MEEKKIKLLEDRDVVDALVLYFRAKSLLENASMQRILKGEVKSPDYKTVLAYANFVDKIDKTVVLANGKKLRYWENFVKEVEDSYRKQLKKGHSGTEVMTRKQINGYEVLKDDPFNPILKSYISTYMSPELTAVIKEALNTDKSALETIRGIRFAVGGSKQSNYTDVVLESLYVGTKLSGLQTENGSLRTQVAELKKRVAEGKKLEGMEAALIASFTGLLEKNTETLTTAMNTGNASIREDIKGLQTSVDNVLAAIDTQNNTLRAENAKLAKSGKVKNVVIAGSALALAIALTLGGVGLAKISEYKNNESSYAEQIQIYENEIADKDAQIAKLTEDYNKINEQYQALLSNPSQDAQAYVDFINDVNAVLTELHQALLEDADGEHKLSAEERASIQEKIDNLTKVEDQVMDYATLIGVSLGGLIVNIDRIQAKADELSVKVSGLESQVAQLQQEGSASAALIASLQSEKDSLLAQVESLQEQLANAGSGDNAALISELRSQISDLESRLATAEAALETVTAERDAAIANNEALTADVSALTARVAELTAALNNAKTPEEYKAIQEELAATKAQLAEVTEERDQLLDEIVDYKDEIAGLKATNADAAAKLAEAIATCKNLQTALDEALAKANSASASLEEANQVIAELRAEIERKLSEASANEEFIRELYYQLTYTNGEGKSVAELRNAINGYLGMSSNKDTSSAEQDQFSR